MENGGNNRRPLVVLCQYFWPEETATAELVSGTIFELARRQVSIAAIAGQPAYRDRGVQLPQLMETEGVRVIRVWSTQLDKNRASGRVLNTLTFCVSTLWACLRWRNPSGFLAVTNPPVLIWIAALMGMVKRVPCYIVVHDLYPQIAVALGKVGSGSWVERIWRTLNRWSYLRADAIIVLGRCMVDAVRRELPDDAHEKVLLVPNWVDVDDIRPMSPADNPLVSELGLAGKFIVQYSGNIGLFHDIVTIGRAAKRLKEHPTVHFLFIGDGGQRAWLEEFVHVNELKNVTILPFQPKARLPITLTACDLGLVSLKSQATGLCVPSKLYGILAAGKPVLAVVDAHSETGRVVSEEECGAVVLPGDDSQLAQTILFLEKDREALARLGDNAREASRKYSIERSASLYMHGLNLRQKKRVNLNTV